MSLINVGSVAVDIVPSAKGFQQKLDAAVRNAQVQVKAVLDDNGVREQLQAVTRDVTARVGVDVDTRAAEAKIQGVTRAQRVRVDVDADTAAAQVKLADLKSQLKTQTLEVNASTDLAKLEIARLQKQIAGTKATLAINADDTQAKETLRRLQAELAAKRAKIDVDTSDAREKLAALKAEISAEAARINVDADTGAASAKLDEVSRPRSATLNVNADTGMAAAKIAAVTVGVAGIAGTLTAVVPAAAAAAAGIAGIGAAAIAGVAGVGVLAMGLKGVVSAVTDTMKAQDGAAAAAAQNAAAQQAAAAKIVSAQQSVKAAQEGLRSSQEGLRSSQAGLANAQAVAADAAIRAAEAVRNAQAGVQEAVVRSAAAIKSAQDAVRQATQQAATSVASALAQEATAERNLQSALQQETSAQKALSDARKQAKQDLDDLNNSVADGALAQRQAVIDVDRARIALQNLGPTQLQIEQAIARTASAQDRYTKLMANAKATQVQRDTAKAALDAAQAQQTLLQQTVGGSALQRQQAQLDYDQALQHQKELASQQQRLTQQQRDAQKKGIEGSSVVQSAKGSLGTAKQGVTDAQAKLRQAQQAVTQSRLDGVAQIQKAEQALANTERTAVQQRQKAEQALADAERSQASQQRQSAYSVAQAQQQVADAHHQIELAQQHVADSQKSLQAAYAKTGAVADTAAQKAASSMAKLTPQGRTLATFITSKVIPGFQQLSDIAQKPVALGALAGLKAAKPALGPLSDLVKTLGGAMGDLLKSAGEALGSPFWVNFIKFINGTAGSSIKTFGTIVGNIAKGFGGLLEAFAPIGQQIGDALVNMSKGFANFGTGKTGGLQSFLGYVEKIGPSVASTFGSLWKLAGNLLKALAPVGGVALGVIKQIADGLNKMPLGDIFQKTLVPALKLFGDIATKVILPLLPQLAPIISAIAGVGEALVGMIVDNMPTLVRVFGLVATIVGQIGELMKTPAFKAVVTELLLMLEGVLKILSGVMDVIIGIFTGNTGKIKKGLHEIFNGLKEIVVAWVTYLMSQSNRIADSIIKVLSGPVRTAKTAIAGFLGPNGPIRSAFTGVKNWVIGAWSKAWHAVKSAIMSPINAARDATGALFGPSGPIRSTFTNVRNWVVGTWAKAWNTVKSVFMSPIDAARLALSGRFGAGGAIRLSFTSLKSWVVGPWSGQWGAVKGILTSPIRDAFTVLSDLLGPGRGGLQTVFSRAVSAIGLIFSKIKGAITGPIKDAISAINHGLIKGGINWILGKLGVDKKNQVPWIPTPKFASGGVFMPHRYTPGQDIGYAALSGSEAIMRPEFTRAVGSDWVDRTNKVARTGGVAAVREYLGGFANGGIVMPTRSGRQNKTYPGHSGIDFYGRDGDPIYAMTSGKISYEGTGRGYGNAIFERALSGLQMVYGHTSAYIAKVGQMVQAGQLIGRVGHSGNVRPSGPAGAHVHVEVAPSGRFDLASNRDATLKWLGGGGIVNQVVSGITGALDFLKGLNPVEWLKNKAASVAGQITSGGIFGRGLANVPGLIIDKAGDWIQNTLGSLVGAGNPTGAGVNRWRGTVGQALKIAGIPQTADYVNAWLRQIGTESGGNPSIVQQISDVNGSGASAGVGLVQVIPSTFAAFRDKSLPNDRTNGLANLVAGMNWEKHKVGIAGMLADIGHGHGYDSGGWLQPGTTIAYNGTGKPEPVFTNQQWASIQRLGERGSDGGGVTVINQGVAPETFAQDIVNAMEKQKRRSAVKHGLRG